MSVDLIEKSKRPTVLESALTFNWGGQMIASTCWVLSIFAYGISTVGDLFQLAAATAWMISNIAALWETQKEVA
ncbi:hypothetical protein KOR42_07470 [Thalassoglobus neptunius]|uniref:Uncharacterized protein n=1 Tax=Thalassoglobus neptunius TaxID=1938619 RepID=A0A5C5X2V5_9PLAN|nr:hypothetical protein [Thalassoglobus neptunius]TWT57387.1 hypothetical protein KOR42_07470 [Thalassoglobus neptunius]